MAMNKRKTLSESLNHLNESFDKAMKHLVCSKKLMNEFNKKDVIQKRLIIEIICWTIVISAVAFGLYIALTTTEQIPI